MGRFKDRFVIVAVFATLGVVGMFISAHQVTAAPPPTAGPNVTIAGPLPLPVTGSIALSDGGRVTVANSTTEPVPVTVTNSPQPAAPITGGGQGDFFDSGETHNYGPSSNIQATALTIQITGEAELLLFFDGNIVGRFPGLNSTFGLGLTRPIRFNKALCSGAAGAKCTFGWVGNLP